MKLNLNDLLYIINESKNILLEDTSVSAAYRKYFSDMDETTYNKIVNSDPTYDENKPDTMGKYGVWLLNQWKRGNINDGNINTVSDNLKIFTKFINRIENKNLQSYKSPDELQRTVQPFIDNPGQYTSNRQKNMKVREDAENVYEDNEWVVIVPKSWEASKVYGAHTRWCTTERDDSYYYCHYSSKAPLYIVISKINKDEKYQIHLPENSEWQFKDKRDDEVDKPAFYLNFTDGLIEFFNGISEKFEETYFRKVVEDLGDGYKFIKSKEGYFLENNGKTIRVYINNIDRFKNGLAKVRKSNKYNYINKDGKLLFGNYKDINIWPDWIDDFNNDGIAKIIKDEYYNIINTEGNILTGNLDDINTWFTYVGNSKYGYTRVIKDGRVFFIDVNGNEINLTDAMNEKLSEGADVEKLFCYCWDSNKDGYNIVAFDRDSYNIYSCERKQLISDIWFNNIDCFADGCARVMLNDRFNFVNSDGKLLYGNPDDINTWFIYAGNFKNGISIVQLDDFDDYIYINTDGDVINISDYINKMLSSKYTLDDLFGHDGYTFVNSNPVGPDIIKVKFNGKYNYVIANKNERRVLSDEWFDWVGKFNKNGVALVKNAKNAFSYITNFMNEKGELLSDRWFEEDSDEQDDFLHNVVNKK